MTRMAEGRERNGGAAVRLRLAAAVCLPALLLSAAVSQAAPAAPAADPHFAAPPKPPPTGPGPTAAEYAALAKLPDFSGVWVPNVGDQFRKANTDRPPWNPKVFAEMAKMESEENAGRPFLILSGCITHGTAALMVITHNALEFLFTPGRVTILGESDGNRLRRIYTDGRKHPEDPLLTMYGHSIGHWEGQTLVVDTVGLSPQGYIATTEGVGVPNDGGMHIVERISLTGPDALTDEVEITAPKVLTKPWKTLRIFRRTRGADADIVEGECTEGNFTPGKDANGHDVFIPIPQSADGSLRSPTQ